MLEIKDLTKKFGGLVAVGDLSFDVRKGEIISVIGPNGSGKTTVFNLITGFHVPSDGVILHAGDNIVGMKPHVIARRGIARTFQHTTVYSQNSVQWNLVVGYRLRTQSNTLDVILKSRRARREERESIERADEIAQFIGLYEKRHMPAESISQEEQKRLAIGIALATDPQLLLLDEPTGGVTDKETGPLIEVIHRINDKGITIVLIEHKMSVVMSISKRIVVLNYGKKIAEGAPADVSSDKNVIEAYLGEGYHA